MKTEQETPVVAGHTSVFTEPPGYVPSVRWVDGPLLGNGDVGVVLSGEAEAQTFWIGKNDFWSHLLHIPLPVGGVSVRLPALTGADYHQEQDMLHAEVCGHFTTTDAEVRMRSWVPATQNLLVTELTNAGKEPIAVEVETWTVAAQHKDYPLHHHPEERLAILKDRDLRAYPTTAGAEEGLLWVSRHAEPQGVAGLDAVVVTRVPGADPRVESDGRTRAVARFHLGPKRTVAIVSAIRTSRESEPGDPLEVARWDALEWEALAEEVQEAHRIWWRNFWSASFIEIADKRVEGYWYGAQYILACCNRGGKVAPGLWGNWITTDRSRWNGDYTLNYNFQSPYFGVFSSNHPELAESFYEAILSFMPQGRLMAREFCCRGVHYPTHIGPYGWHDKRDFGQRSNALYCALLFIDHYEYTCDRAYLRDKIYPFLTAVADFWEDYLERDENGRYVIYRGNAHEARNRGRNTNAIQHIAFLPRLFRALLTASADLDVDADRREKWQDILDHLSGFSFMERNGRTVFRLSEDECRFTEGGPIVCGIFPGGQVDLDSDPELLEIARNTVAQANAWHGNGFPRIFPAAVRVGHPDILSILNDTLAQDMPPNYYVRGGGGIETCGATLAVNEMLLQSHQGFLRFFPVWPAEQAARFGRLRARGAFLVSAALRDGAVEKIKIESEQGRDCAILNPWPGRNVTVSETVDGKTTPVAVVQEGSRFTFDTRPGGKYTIAPE